MVLKEQVSGRLYYGFSGCSSRCQNSVECWRLQDDVVNNTSELGYIFPTSIFVHTPLKNDEPSDRSVKVFFRTLCLLSRHEVMFSRILFYIVCVRVREITKI